MDMVYNDTIIYGSSIASRSSSSIPNVFSSFQAEARPDLGFVFVFQNGQLKPFICLS